ncbi:Lrp/AsnC ligand binding domain-containing protein [Streptomyces sp. MZ04]|uniref:Lrp/AsnC ligand binding domain-containing protein n=1 Tax=Streptomyces sp. MZ04 TaxID=2559236 RepID=UPI00107E6BFF|nr:Lrp/AsnC ligand binding domain-containing protein [Streptomyces sp. MZ04]TGB14234.1 Lrp/AsnC family transcriptional regulator [Streptomyces sp. MZ04]
MHGVGADQRLARRIEDALLDHQAARELAKLPETRLCVGVSGPQNLVATVWVRSLGDVQALEVRLAHALPHLRIVDRAVALRAVKLMGRLLDAGGRAVGFVPIDLWNGEYA